MAFVTGSERGPAGVISWIGIIAGFAVTALVAGFLIFGAIEANESRPEGYDSIDQPMSDLGDATDDVGTAFMIVQFATAALFVAIAVAVHRRVPGTGDTVIGLLLIAALTVGLGLTRCTDGDCDSEFVDIAHWVVAISIALLIVAVPLSAASQVPQRGLYTPIRTASRYAWKLAGAAVIVHGLVAWARPEWDGATERLIWIVGYGWLLFVAGVMAWRRRGEQRHAFEIGQIQAGVLYGSKRWKRMELLGVTLTNTWNFRRWLGEALQTELVRAEEEPPVSKPDERTPWVVTVLFTRNGLRQLDQAYEWTAEHTEDAFCEGAHERAELLGDVGPSCPDTWSPGWGRDGLDVVFWVRATNDDEMTGAKDAIGDAGQPGEPTVLVHCKPITEDDSDQPIEHFGFADGLSTTWVESIHPTDEPDRWAGGNFNGRMFEPVALGEFVLGELDDDGRNVFPVPEPRSFYDRGSFVVLRKLQQNVPAFRSLCEDLARRAEIDAEDAVDEVGSRLVGRARDGTPLAGVEGDGGLNDFLYGQDPEGYGCPVGAHIRRSNPRDSLGFDGIPAHRRRIMRRGMTYGDRYDPDHPDNAERGLMFIAVNARITEQFEFIQRSWLNDGFAFAAGHNPDPIAGSWDNGEKRSIVIPGRPPVVADLPQPLVATRGAAYTFAPSMAALHHLADASDSEDSQ